MKQAFSGRMKNSYCVDIFYSFLKPYIDSGKALVYKVDSFPDEEAYLENVSGFVPLAFNSAKILLQPHKHVKDKRMLPFARERYLRDFGVNKILEHFGNDRNFGVLVSDADELVDVDMIPILRCYQYETHLSMITLIYNTKWRIANEDIHATMYLPARGITTSTSFNYIRFHALRKVIIPGGGWHMTKFLPESLIIKRIEHTAHVEFDLLELKAPAWIKHCVENGLDYLNRTDPETGKQILNIIPYKGQQGLPNCPHCVDITGI